MAHVDVRGDPADLNAPTMIEGLPGVGLVGKIATDHVIDQFDMDYYAGVRCDGIPDLGVYHDGSREVLPPVRLYVDEERDLLALRSDVPVSSEAATEFADCVTSWLADEGATPLYVSGLPAEKDGEVPSLYAVATGDAGPRLDEADLDPPAETGAVSGPTGALLARASETDLDGAGLVVESDPQFPDPEAARVVVKRGFEPVVGVDVEVDALVERAEEIRDQKEKLARRMQEAQDDESTQAKPLRMFQ